MTFARLLLTAILSLAALPWAGWSQAASEAGPSNDPTLLARWGFEQHTVVDRLRRKVTYYIAHGSTRKPLLLAIQGSGCDQLFPSHRNQSGVYNVWPPGVRAAADGRFTVLVVEKPHSQPQRDSTRFAEDCGPDFNADFSADRWLVALLAALRAAEASSWSARGGAYVLGHSEGAPMAALVASHAREITGLAFLAGPGDTQAYDTLLSAYERGGTTPERAKLLEEAETRIRQVMSDPANSRRFVGGHTFLRWSSFYKLSTIDDLRRTRARVYVASGTADLNEPFWSTQVAVARLLADGRDVKSHVVVDGDHSFHTPGDPDPNSAVAEYRRALAWLLAP